MQFQDVPIKKLEVLRAAKPSNYHFRIRSEASQEIKILVFVVMSVVEGSTRDRENYLSLVTEQEVTELALRLQIKWTTVFVVRRLWCHPVSVLTMA